MVWNEKKNMGKKRVATMVQQTCHRMLKLLLTLLLSELFPTAVS